VARNRAIEHGVPDGPPMVLAHGFGCDHNMWRYVWPAFADRSRIVLSRTG
jgi:sigma-B regulation protein RsbQ